MICPVCQHDTLIVAEKVQRFDNFDQRLLRCEECRCEFVAENRLTAVKVRNPETRKHYDLPIVQLDEPMADYLLGRRLHPTIHTYRNAS